MSKFVLSEADIFIDGWQDGKEENQRLVRDRQDCILNGQTTRSRQHIDLLYSSYNRPNHNQGYTADVLKVGVWVQWNACL